ncbi:hypothetical protein NERG_01527 [Nematocida ausubeli]|uniref:Uncharacterized protein n=1 Tax=Nematocida ausubeli (strain ATCC PRA-371 / ERTm2) TaxID=1913371 RepID=H8ZD56_NEMA1|nr:hypothetical protein NERG_01527 [Nematocida ausubeli]
MNPKIIMIAATAITVLFVVGLWNLLRNPTIKQEKKAATSPNECTANRQLNIKKDAVQARKSSIEADVNSNEENSQTNFNVYGVLQTNFSLVKEEAEYSCEKMDSGIEIHEDDNCGSDPELLQLNKVDELSNSIPETQCNIEAKETESNFEDILAINVSTLPNIRNIKENPTLNTYTIKSLLDVEDATNSQNGDEEVEEYEVEEEEEYEEESSEEEEEEVNEEENPSTIQDQATSETPNTRLRRFIIKASPKNKRRKIYSPDGYIIFDGYRYLDVPIPRKKLTRTRKSMTSTSVRKTAASAPKAVASTSVPKAAASCDVPKAAASTSVRKSVTSTSVPKAVTSTSAPETTPTTNPNNQPECLSPPPAYTGQPDSNEHPQLIPGLIEKVLPQSTWNLETPSTSHNLNSVRFDLGGEPFGFRTNVTCDFENILYPNQEESTPKTNQLGEDFYTDASKISQRYKNELKPLNDASETKITPENPATPKGRSVTFDLEKANLNINAPVPALRKNIPTPSAPEESLLEKNLYPILEKNLYPVIEKNEKDVDLVEVDPYDYTSTENVQESSAEAGFSDNNSDGVTSTKDKSKKKKTKGLMKGAIKSILGKRKNKNSEEADEAAISGSEEIGNLDQSTSQSSMK